MSRNAFKGISFDGVHSYDDLGLYMAEYPEFDMPDIQEHWVSVPGRDGKLNLTKSLDGFTHYDNRSGTLEFLAVGTKSEGMAMHSRLGNLLHGQQIEKLVWDEDDGYYYTGQCEVSGATYKDFRTKITVKCDLEPYKYEMFAVGEDWLWDSLDFENGTIRDIEEYTYEVSGASSYVKFTVPASQMPTVPTIHVYSATGLTIRQYYSASSKGTEVALADCTAETSYDTKTPYIVLSGTSYIQIKGTGKISVIFQGGSL